MSSLHYIFYGGEELAPETETAVNEVLKKCGVNTVLKKGFGMTEITSAASATYDFVNAIGSVGIPLSKTNCKIVEPDTDIEIGYNQEGEICFHSPTLMLGYYNQIEATNEIIRMDEDGKRWLHTGDLGYITEKGIVYVTGRIKRIYMTKGKDGQVTKMFPDRIEKAILTHPMVKLCCVIGVQDQDRIHYPKAFIAIKGESNRKKTEEEILAICEQTLPGYMVPEEIQFVDDMPRTPRGKIDYRALEELAAKDLQRA